MNSFVHLHVHSHYSLLEATSSIPSLVDKAMKLGMPAIALTDHGNMFGIMEFYNYIQKRNGRIKLRLRDFEERLQYEKLSEIKITQIKAEIVLCQKQIIKPILGCEVYIVSSGHKFKFENENRGGYQLVLLAKNMKGYENLCRIVSIGWKEGMSDHPRIDHDLLEKYCEGIIACSAGLEGEINKKIENGILDEAEKAIVWYKRVFGDDFYIELQRHNTNKPNGDNKTYHQQMVQGKLLVELAQKTNTNILATNDAHFVEEDHGEAHDRFICLRSDTVLDDSNRKRYTQQEWLKTAEEMCQIFADLPEAISATLEIANKVEFYEIDSDVNLPKFAIPISFGTEEKCRSRFTLNMLRTEFGSGYFYCYTHERMVRLKLEADYLTQLIMEGAKFRYGGKLTTEQSDRITFEMKIIKMMGFPTYFLILHEIITAARKMNVYVGPGCGSAAGSLVAYCLRITNIDPLKHDLLFERFMNPNRCSVPNIELDFDEEGRKLILCWLEKRYGKERVARIINYGVMDTKISIREMARVHGVPQHETDRLIKLIPEELPEDADGHRPKVNIPNCIKHIPELHDALNSEDKCLSDTLKYAAMLEGALQSTGISPCGVVIGSVDLINLVPLSIAIDKETKEEVLVTQYESNFIKEIGLVELNFWGLKNLSVIKETLSNIKRSNGIELDIEAIPDDDITTYQLIRKGLSTRKFQYASAEMQKQLQALQPTQFEDLIAMYALCRPGIMQQIPSFINRKNGREKIEYPFPEMEKVLKNSYGITLYQEQVMMLSRLLAGFTAGESAKLRIAMGKQLIKKKKELKALFIYGCEENGFGPRAKLDQIWNDWGEIAKYTYLKSHATSSAWIIYQTAYLEAHYPEEFKAAQSTCNADNSLEAGMCIDEYKYQFSNPIH